MLSRQKPMSSRSRSAPASNPGIGCTTALTSSPRSSLGTPMTAASMTLGWVTRRFSVLRIDVHATRDDHVRLAVGEVQVALVVEVTDVADRAHHAVVRVPPRLGRLGR